MSELIDTTEMYLKTVYELEEDGVTPLRARIVERLDHSGPTVSQTVARMERDGLMKVAEDRSLQLTAAGRARATEVIRKHRLAERLLLDVIGMDRALVHEEACRWEHVMSERVEAQLLRILDGVRTDPFGNPIPRLDCEHPHPSSAECSLMRAVRDGWTEGHISRIGEPIQADSQLIARCEEAGITAGALVNVRATGAGVRLVGSAQDPVVLSADMAQHLFLKH